MVLVAPAAMPAPATSSTRTSSRLTIPVTATISRGTSSMLRSSWTRFMPIILITSPLRRRVSATNHKRRLVLWGLSEGSDRLADVVAVAHDDCVALEVARQVLALRLGCQHGRAVWGQDDGAGPDRELGEEVKRAALREVPDHEATEGSRSHVGVDVGLAAVGRAQVPEVMLGPGLVDVRPEYLECRRGHRRRVAGREGLDEHVVAHAHAGYRQG